jgi:hypothetical protein
METKTRSLATYGNCTLVQFEATPFSTIPFKPGGPEIEKGGLVISEESGNGTVGKLVAVNNTGDFLLLTDADVLIGAKQNRILKKSVRLPPISKTRLDVSCIERRRWHYTTPRFTSPSTVADPDLRQHKARSISANLTNPETEHQTQNAVWSHISRMMDMEEVISVTENYSDLVSHRSGKQKAGFPVIEPEPGCNGLAVFHEKKIQCIDIFGTEDVFRHYFPKLRDSAFLQATFGKNNKPMEKAEAFFWVLDLLDRFGAAEETKDETYCGAGSMSIRDEKGFMGFVLDFERQPMHCCLFGKTVSDNMP